MRSVKQFLLFSVFFFCVLILTILPASAYTSGQKIVVMLDPGHSEGDGGGTYAGTHLECWYNMKIALACKEALEANGNFVVYLSHPDNNTAATLLQRAQAADKVNADVMVSLHVDGSDNAKLKGAEVMYSILPRYAMPELSEMLLTRLTEKTGLERRGLYTRADTGDGKHVYYWNSEKCWDIPDDKTAGSISDYYGIITWGAKFGIPTVIVEHGFMTNAHDVLVIEDEEQLKKMGQADAAALIAYYTGHTHTWSSARTTDYPTSCCYTGKASYRCSVCGARKGTTSLAASTGKEHYYYISESKKRTCTENGYTVYTCRIADNLTDKGYNVGAHTYTTKEYATGHNYVVTEDRAVTHTVDGVHTEVCSYCGDTVTKVTKAEGHTWVEESRTEATCTEDGVLRMVCTGCGEVEETVTPAFGHTFVVTEEREPTCTEEGLHVEVCTVCGETVSESSPPRGHVIEMTIAREPTCEEEGLRLFRCTVCGYETTEPIPATGHAYDDGTVEKEATFFSDGLMRFVCEHDGSHTYTEVLPRRAETWQIAALFGGTGVCAAGILAFVLISILRRKKLPAAEPVGELIELENAGEPESEKAEEAERQPVQK